MKGVRSVGDKYIIVNPLRPQVLFTVQRHLLSLFMPKTASIDSKIHVMSALELRERQPGDAPAPDANNVLCSHAEIQVEGLQHGLKTGVAIRELENMFNFSDANSPSL